MSAMVYRCDTLGCACSFICDCLLCIRNVLFFFFKQKTAYEMCGRDWSSDVCSSDLSSLIIPLQQDLLIKTEEDITGLGLISDLKSMLYEIGRASCRERV